MVNSNQPEDVIFDFLYSQYVLYRAALPDPTVLPPSAEILWSEPKSELIPHAFVVVRTRTDRSIPFLGQKALKVNDTCIARFATTWLKALKPDVIDEFEKFLEYEIVTNVTNTFFTSKGYKYVLPGSSTVVEPRDPENDQWVLNFEIYAESLKSY